MKSGITPGNRPTILAIKNHFFAHPEYRRGFSSMDIYNSVLKEGIRSVFEFSQWLKDNKGISER